jgi:hypothetical protein
MGIDKFINHYLDGELTPDEDKEFRDLIDQDPNAREEFDMMLSIYSILKEDAESISVPQNLSQKVEERILASYLNISTPVQKPLKKRLSYAIASVCLLLLFGIQNINDGRLVSSNTLFVAEVIKQQELLENQVTMLQESNSESVRQVPIESNSKEILKVTPEENVASVKITNSSAKSYYNKDLATSSQPDYSEFLDLSSTINNEHNLLAQMQMPRVNYFTTKLSMPNPESVTLPKNGSKFILASEIPSSGIALTGLSTIPLKKYGFEPLEVKSYGGFSQSVGYRIGNNFRVGLEFGYIDFVYSQMTTILVPAIRDYAPSKKIYAKSSEDKGPEAFILTNGEDNPTPKFIQVVVPIERKYQSYWGSLFVDYEYPLAKALSLVGRINLGATGEGFLGGLVLFAEIQPVYGITFNIGVENKSYWSAVPKSTYSMKNVIGLVYGLSIKLDINNH